MSATSFESAFADLLRSIVRDEIRNALADARAEPRNASGADTYLSISKAARFADVAPGTVRTWIRRGRLPAKRAGRVLRISRGELETFLTACANRNASPNLATRAREIRRAA